MTERELGIRITAEISQFTASMVKGQMQIKTFADTTESQIGRIEQSTERLSRLWKSLFEAAIAVEAIDGLKKIAEAANDTNDSLQIAAQSAKNFGHSFNVDGVKKSIEQLAMSVQGGGYAIQDMRDAVAQFTAVGATQGQSMRLLTDAIGLAAAKHMTLAEAVHIASYAAEGHIDMLSRYGIQTKDAEGKTLSFAQVMKNWERDVGGDAQKRAEGLMGSFGALGKVINDLANDFGSKLIPAFAGLSNVASKLILAFLGLPSWIRATVEVSAALTVAFTAAALILPVIQKGIFLVAEGFKLAFSAGRALVTGFQELVPWLGLAKDAFAGEAVAEWASMAPIAAIVAGLVSLALILTEVIRHAKDFGNAWNDSMHYASDSWNEFIAGVKSGAIDIKPVLADVADMMLSPTNSPQRFAAAARLVHDAAPKSAAKWNSRLDKDYDKSGSDVVNDIKGVFSSVLGVFKGSPADWTGLGGPTKPEKTKKKKTKDTSGEQWSAAKSAIQAILDRILAGLQFKLGQKLGAIQGTQSYDRFQIAGRRAFGISDPVADASDNLDIAAEARKAALAKSKDENKEWTARVAAFTAEAVEASKHLKGPALAKALSDISAERSKAAMAHNAKVQALALEQQGADQDVEIAKIDLANAEKKKAGRFRNGLLQGFLGQVPGVGQNQQTGALTFNWMQVLAEAIQRSKSYADIMRVVNEVMNVFAQIIDAFRPVIDALLSVVLGVVKAFIGLWNAVAKILALFGIHIQQLQLLTSLDTAPLVQLFHDIPTLNELATGKVGTLQTIDSQRQQLQNGLTESLNSPDLGGGILGVLGEILGGILALKVVMGLFGGGGGGGLLGAVSNLFGGKGGAGGLTGLLGKFGLTFGSGTNGTALLGTMGVLAGAAILGSVVGKMEGGGSHTTNAAIGGVVGAGATAMVAGGMMAMGGMAGGLSGGMAGLLAMGPAGWAALAGGALLGALLGGVFGHAAPNTHDNPDITVGGYGQELADLQGSGVYMGKDAMNANGSSYTESGQVSQALGGKGMIQYIADYIAQTGGAGLTDAEKATFQGEDVKDTIVNGKDGTLDLANGTSIYWTDLEAQAQDALQRIGQAFQNMATGVGAGLAAVAQPVRDAWDYAANGLTGIQPGMTPGGAPATGTVSSGSGDAAQRNDMTQPVPVAPVTVILEHTGPIYGFKDLDEIASRMAERVNASMRNGNYSLQGT